MLLLYKKIQEIEKNSPYILLFHCNGLTSWQWQQLKKVFCAFQGRTLFQPNYKEKYHIKTSKVVYWATHFWCRSHLYLVLNWRITKQYMVTIMTSNLLQPKSSFIEQITSIIMGLDMFSNSILCDVVSIFLQYKCFFYTYVSSLCIQSDTIHWNRPFSWKTSIVWLLRPKCHITRSMTFG